MTQHVKAFAVQASDGGVYALEKIINAWMFQHRDNVEVINASMSVTDYWSTAMIVYVYRKTKT